MIFNCGIDSCEPRGLLGFMQGNGILGKTSHGIGNEDKKSNPL